MMEFINEYGYCVPLIVLLIVVAIYFRSSVGSASMFEQKPKQKRVPWKVERKRIEEDLFREYPDLVTPRNEKQAARFAEISKEEARRNRRAAEDANYDRNIRQAVLWTTSDSYISAEGHKVDVNTNKVIEYNVAPRRK